MNYLTSITKHIKPIAFGKYKRLGPEAVFAISMGIGNAIFTNIVTLGSLPPLIFSVDEIEPESPLTGIQKFHILAFNFSFVYIAFVYFTMALCDPGRINTEEEKQFLRDRF